MRLNWENGRQLSGSGDGSAGSSAGYEYNDAGLRISKTRGPIGTTNYYYNGDALVTQILENERMDFYYDDAGNLFGFNHNGTDYYYIRNGQNDITGILDKDGNQVVNYVYDAWGNQEVGGTLAETIGQLNPFRYRSYYYDAETNYYYLNSRYYDPSICRFINADTIVDTGHESLGTNMFAYCLNNPTNMFDDDGELPKFIVDFTNCASKALSKMNRSTIVGYYAIKTSISVAGKIALKKLKMPLTSAMFNQAIWGNGKSFGSSTKNMMIGLLKNSRDVKNMINRFTSPMVKSFSKSASIHFKAGDLHYAIQKANIKIVGKKQKNGSWYLTITLSDTYDFTEFRKGLGFSDISNNLGWAMQQNGMMRPYRWSVTYSYTYWR